MYYEFRPTNPSMATHSKAVVIARSREEAFEMIYKLTDLEVELVSTYEIRPQVIFCSILPF